MPKMPPRPCTHPSCREYAVLSGRCEAHKHKAWDHGKTAEQRGYGSLWRKIRKGALKRDDYLCQQCKNEGIYREGNNVDHITPKALGGSDSLDNLQTLCTSCHNEKTTRERTGRTGGI